MKLPEFVEVFLFKNKAVRIYQIPDWFRDAKFGIWSHWGPQSAIEDGDWYARNMYIEGSADYKFHLANYGHPSKVGFMEIDHLWKAEKWDPGRLIALYKRAGAKYFFGLANHHDNFDNWNSRHQPWNSVALGPQNLHHLHEAVVQAAMQRYAADLGASAGRCQHGGKAEPEDG